MGASLSQQEQLFVDLRWQELLENAMEADMTEQEAAASGQSDQKNAQKGFRVSFNELQGFLSVLEYGQSTEAAKGTRTEGAQCMSPAFSQVCDRLTIDQLHSPVIVLMVHVCSWWAGAIDDTTLKARIDGLCALIATKVAKLTGQSVTSTAGAAHDDDGDDDDKNESGELVVVHKPSKRARALRLLRRRFSGGGSRGASDEKGMQALQLDVVTDLISLFTELVADRAMTETERTAATTTTTQRRATQSRRAVFDRLANLVKTDERPMVGVALCFLLAVFADRTTEAILYAEDGVAQLRRLTGILATSTSQNNSNAKEGASKRSQGTGRTEVEGEVTVRPADWHLVRQLEASLMIHQYELDAVQAVGRAGQAMVASMRAIEQSRLQVNQVPLAAMSAQERWRYGMTQYVGQRHVWDTLRQHFLSADLFDTEKPTVMVLFGPSGYGKSEMAKRLASVLHGCPIRDLEASGKLVHIHMPSFCTKDSIYSLVDPPAAHVGDGILLSALLKADDAVVVLDEFEKSTADAIQNLWLSAFQKNGTLRSLKKADRCVSTVRTTFVLTCNTSAAYIDSRASRYLGADADERRSLRDEFVSDCRQAFQQTLGDPFVNRVDYFLPFVPYTREERTQFVGMQLERLLTHQREKGRQAYVTPRFVKVLVDELKTFHASTIEEIVRPLIVRMAERHDQTSVLTVLARASATPSSGATGSSSRHPGFAGFTFVVLPAHRKKLPSGEVVEWTVPEGADAGDGVTSTAQGGGGVPFLSWEEVKGGADALTLWQSTSTTATTRAVGEQSTLHVAPTEMTRAAVDLKTVGTGDVPVAGAPLQVEMQLELQKEAEKSLTTETEREKALAREVEMLKETIVEKDKQIVTLKEMVWMLQKALAVMMCMVLCCGVVMVMVVGLKLTLLLLGLMLFLLCVVLGVPLRVLLGAVWAFFQFLGPVKSAVLMAILAMWVYRAGASMVMQCQ